MAVIPPNASWHYFGMGFKDTTLAKDKLAACLVNIRGTDFEDGNEIETETDQGHTGTSNLDMGSYRKNATSAPTWEDGMRYSEGLEDYWYGILGAYEVTAHLDDNEDPIAGVYDYAFTQAAEGVDLPLATIYNGFQKTSTDARVWNNAMINEFEVTFSNEDLPKVNPTWISDYNNFNLVNPTRSFREPSIFVKAPQTQVYLGAVGADVATMLANPIDCFTEASFSINQNAEDQACHQDAFGVNTKMMGAREVTGSITMPWTDATKYLETEYEGYDKYAHIVSEDITNKQVWFVAGGPHIFVEDAETHEMTDTGVAYNTTIKFPEVEITSVTSPKSGEDAKDLTLEFKVLEKPSQSYMTVDMVSDLEDLHIDDTGITLASLYPSGSPFNGN